MKIFDRLSNYQSIAPFLVIVFFILSIAAGAMPAEPIFLGMWILYGVIGIIFLKVAYPHSFLYGLWLLVIYILTGVGVLFMNGIGLSGGQGIGVGILLEVLAIYIFYHLIFQVKGLRDIGEGPYVPLGIWSISVILFFLFANGAFASLVGWAKWGGDGVNGYITFEILMVLVVVFIFNKAEQCIVYLEEGPAAIKKGRGAPVRLKKGEALWKAGRPLSTGRGVVKRKKRRRASKKARPCPICRSELKLVKRACPECDDTESTAICKKAGHLFIPCPSCGIANFHGRYRCKRCNARLSETILCRSCGKENDLNAWRKVGGTSRKKVTKEG